MAPTPQKRQREMKRQEKQRAKAERRAQKKLANRSANEVLERSPTEQSAVVGESELD